MESTVDLDGILIPTPLFRVSMLYIPPACQSLSRDSHLIFGITYKIQYCIQFWPSTVGQHKTDCMSLILYMTQNKSAFVILKFKICCVFLYFVLQLTSAGRYFVTLGKKFYFLMALLPT